jgi:hypothetical protein
VRDDFSSSGSTSHAKNALSKTVYYFPPAMKSFLQCDQDGKLKIVAAGIKVFERKTKNGVGDSDYRLLQVTTVIIY